VHLLRILHCRIINQILFTVFSRLIHNDGCRLVVAGFVTLYDVIREISVADYMPIDAPRRRRTITVSSISNPFRYD
jgi:hypothetical protein